MPPPTLWPGYSPALSMISQGFGPHTREQWLALTAPQLRRDAQGGWIPHYDPSIAMPFRAVTPELAAAGEAALWQAYDRLQCPTLLLHPDGSPFIPVSIMAALHERLPDSELNVFGRSRHGLPFSHAAQCAQSLRTFLDSRQTD